MPIGGDTASTCETIGYSRMQLFTSRPTGIPVVFFLPNFGVLLPTRARAIRTVLSPRLFPLSRMTPDAIASARIYALVVASTRSLGQRIGACAG